MMNAVESRAVIIDDYVASAEEYLKAFALSGEVHAMTTQLPVAIANVLEGSSVV